MNTGATTIGRDEIHRRVAERYRRWLERGDGWHYVRVWPDGDITDGIEPSRQVPESEYFGRSPHPVTIWESRGFAGALDDDEIEAEMDGLDDDWFRTNLPDLEQMLEATGLQLKD